MSKKITNIKEPERTKRHQGCMNTYGENCECVCQGLQDMFEFIGKVPLRIVFDNATGIGKRICGELQESESFTRFRMHYGWEQ